MAENTDGNGDLSLGDLIPDKRNARKHNPRNIGLIEKSIQEVGVSRSGVIDEDGNILAGNGTYEALAAAGITKIKVVEADGNEWVLVQRNGLSAEQKAKLAMYDNHTAELAEWYPDILGDIIIEFPDIRGTVFSQEELAAIVEGGFNGGNEPLDGEDDAPEPPATPRTKPGDLYEIGPHRLLCGDSTDPAQIEILMATRKADLVFTDPPYGVDYTGKTSDALKLKNDQDASAWEKAVAVLPIEPGTSLYVCVPDGPNLIKFEIPFQKHCHHACNLIWNKNALVLGRGDYNYKHEPILFGWKLGGAHKFYGGQGEPTVWDIDRPSASKHHPTMKPTRLVERALMNSSLPNHIVFDPFGGSGTTMIACEKPKRHAYLMELDPIYCDVIIKRYVELFNPGDIRLNGEVIDAEAFTYADEVPEPC